MSQAEIKAHLQRFDEKEEALLARMRVLGGELTESLREWPLWIGDSVRYLHELRNHVEALEKKFAEGQQ